MRQLRSDRDLREMLAETSAVLFVFVNWSEYADRGQSVCKEAESKLATMCSKGSLSWWIVDVSSIDSPPNPALYTWLKDQDTTGAVRVFPGRRVGKWFCRLDQEQQCRRIRTERGTLRSQEIDSAHGESIGRIVVEK
jgi:hypothetical protein